MSTSIRRYTRQAIIERGWRSGSDLEDRAARWLHSGGFRPGESIEQQYRVGRYRLDFAFPDVQVDLEIDGPFHRFPDTAAKDVERDSWLRSQGWLVFRVDDRYGEEAFADQLVRICSFVHGERRWRR